MGHAEPVCRSDVSGDVKDEVSEEKLKRDVFFVFSAIGDDNTSSLSKSKLEEKVSGIMKAGRWVSSGVSSTSGWDFLRVFSLGLIGEDLSGDEASPRPVTFSRFLPDEGEASPSTSVGTATKDLFGE